MGVRSKMTFTFHYITGEAEESMRKEQTLTSWCEERSVLPQVERLESVKCDVLFVTDDDSGVVVYEKPSVEPKPKRRKGRSKWWLKNESVVEVE